MTDKLPTISVVIATFNSERTIERCLCSVRNQDYPQNKIEIILADGGSTDKTLEIVKQFKPKIIRIKADVQNAEYNKGLGVRKAVGDLILMIDHDNILPHNNWLKKMIEPFDRHAEVVAVETLYYHYDRSYSLLDRYFALFGAGDPLAFYLGKADHLSYLYDKYNLYGKEKDYGDYYLVKFDDKHIPTLGANGFLIKKQLLTRYARIKPDEFFHIDVNVDLIRKGLRTYAFIKDSIIHLTGYKSVSGFLFRRKLFMEQFYFQKNSVRRYSVYQAGDEFKLMKFIVYSISFIKPTYDALRGYCKIHDKAWFLHPFLCFALFFIYSYVAMKMLIKKYARQIFSK